MDNLFYNACMSDFERIIDAVMSNITYKKDRKISNTYPELEQNEINAVENDLRKIISNSNFNVGKIEETMAAKNWDTGKIKYFVNILTKEKTNLMFAFLNHHTSKYGETIVYSDWILKLVFGTSDLNTIRYPLLQLILSTIDSNGEYKLNMFELNKDMLVKMIETLENVTSDLSYVSKND